MALSATPSVARLAEAQDWFDALEASGDADQADLSEAWQRVVIARDDDVCPSCHQSYDDLGDQASLWTYHDEDEGYTCTCPDLAAEERERAALVLVAARRQEMLASGICDHGHPVQLCCACGGF